MLSCIIFIDWALLANSIQPKYLDATYSRFKCHNAVTRMAFAEQGPRYSCSGTFSAAEHKNRHLFCPNVHSASAGIWHGVLYMDKEGEEYYGEEYYWNTFITVKLNMQTRRMVGKPCSYSNRTVFLIRKMCLCKYSCKIYLTKPVNNNKDYI